MIEIESDNTIASWLKNFPVEAPVVVVVTHNRYDKVAQCLDKLARQDEIALAVIDDGSTDAQVPLLLGKLAKQYGFLYLSQSNFSGRAASINQAFRLFSPRDVVVLGSDTIVPPGWLERLKAAAHLRTNIATATSFSNYGGYLSVPDRNTPNPAIANGLDTDQADAMVQQTSLHLTPIIPAGFPHCIYYKRSTLELVGGLDETLPIQAAEIDFAQRATAAGFGHVVADDLFIFHEGLDFEEAEVQQEIDSAGEVLQARYPWYEEWQQETEEAARSSLAVALDAARAAFYGYRIAIDATALGLEKDNNQGWLLDFSRALVNSPERPRYCQKLSLVTRNGVTRKDLQLSDDLPGEIELISYSQMCNLPKAYFDLLYRPLQIQTLDDLYDFKGVTTRFAITQADFKAFANPGCSDSYEAWNSYRYLTHLSFSQVDGIAFFNDATLQESLLQGMQPEENRRAVTGVESGQFFSQAKIPAGGPSFEGYNWESTARKTWDFFGKLLKMPPRQLEVTVQSETDRNRKAAYLNLQENYERLEKWANELNQKVLGYEHNKTYKIVSRFNRGPFKNGGQAG